MLLLDMSLVVIFFFCSVISIVSVLMLAAYAIYRDRRFNIPGIKAFIVCMLIGALWALFQGLEFIVSEYSQKLIFDTLKYLPAALAPVVWLYMVLSFSGRDAWANLKNLMIASIIPILTAVLVWFDPDFNIVRTEITMVEGKYFPLLHKEFGLWFWIHYSYSGIINGMSVFFLVDTIFETENYYRKQAVIFLISLGLIGSFSVLYTFGLSPLGDIDISPFVFIIASIVTLIGIIGYGLFDIIPVSRNYILKKIDVGVIITDGTLRILDMNESANKILNVNSKKVIGKNIKLIAEELIPPIEQCLKPDKIRKKRAAEIDSMPSHKQLKYRNENREIILDVKTEQLYEKRRRQNYWIITIDDITATQQAKEKIEQQNRELAVLEEQQRLSRELHDNLGQKVSFSKVQLQAIQREIQMKDFRLALEHINRLNDVLGQTHTLIREYVYNLRSKSFADSSFPELISELIKDNFVNAPVDFRVEIAPETKGLFEKTDKKFHLISLTKEAINNSLKYSRASEIQIGTRKIDGKIYYYIKDNGHGFSSEISNQNQSQTYGLKIMRERAILTQGEMQILSSETEGTLIQVCYTEK